MHVAGMEKVGQGLDKWDLKAVFSRHQTPPVMPKTMMSRDNEAGPKQIHSMATAACRMDVDNSGTIDKEEFMKVAATVDHLLA